MTAQGNDDLLEILLMWTDEDRFGQEKDLRLLLSLFKNPMKLSATHSNVCIAEFGSEALKCAVRNAGLGNMSLHLFHQTIFLKDVLTSLKNQFNNDHLKITEWFCEQNDLPNATNYCGQHLKTMTDDELIQRVILEWKLSPASIFSELDIRGMQIKGAEAFLQMKPPAVN